MHIPRVSTGHGLNVRSDYDHRSVTEIGMLKSTIVHQSRDAICY